MRGLVKIHGGKSYIKDWVISKFPSNYTQMTYVECFVGGGSILLNKQPSVAEVINDRNKSLINVYQVLKLQPEQFINQLLTIEYNEETFETALNDKDNLFDDLIDEAVNTYILYRMSSGGMGKSFAFSNRLRGNKPGDQNAWQTSIENLINISMRLKYVLIYNKDYRDVINEFNNEDIFIYLDPPYMASTRVSKAVYDHEMSERSHKNLLELITQSKAKILISGYNNNLYDSYIGKWDKSEKQVVNQSSRQLTKAFRDEVLWRNYL